MDKAFTKFPNDILEELCSYHLSPLQMQIILYVIRKTRGYGKEMDTIAVSKMAQDIGRTRCRVSTAVSDLEKMNILKVERTGRRIGNRMGVKDASEWEQPVTKREHVTKKKHVTKRERQVLPNGNAKCYQTGTHKRNYTKETIQKKPPISPIEKNRHFASRPYEEMMGDEERARLEAEGWTL